MSPSLRIPLALLLAGGLLSGCGSATRTTEPLSSGLEQGEITAELAQQPEIMDDGVSESPDEIALAAAGLEGSAVDAAIRPLTFWREFRLRERRFEFAFSDSDSTGRPTRALVTVRTHLRGRLHILAGPPPADGEAVRDSVAQIVKPFDEIRLRRVLMVRVRGPQEARMRWRVAACSGVEVASNDHLANIRSLRIRNGALDVTVTDPLALVRLRDVLRLDPNSDVQLTVTTDRSDDVLVLHHARLRLRLQSNGDNTYSGSMPVGLFVARMRHFGVDAMSRGTLFDDEAPYDSERWVLPFVIAPETLDDPMPEV
jgi:hypothetical protein